MAAAIGNSSNASDTNGLFVDVRDFGAKAVAGFNNTPAFQAAVDFVVSKGGGTVYIPGSGNFPNYYFLAKPVYVGGDRVSIVGDGKNATVIWTWGPAFIFSPHPKKWATKNTTSYVDTDTGAAVPVRDSSGNFIFDQRFRTDLYRFTPNGDLKDGGSGQTPLDAPLPQPGSWFGVRGRNVVKGIFFGNPLANGGLSGWESQKQATFDFIYFAHDRIVEGGIAGMGERNDPDPWLFSCFNGQLEFAMYLTDDTLINRALIRLKFPHPATKGLHRVSVQVDWTNQQFTVFVDRVQVNYTIEYLKNIQASELFTKYNSFARWEYSDFAVCSRNRNSSLNDDTGMVNSDYTVIGTKVYPSARYNVKTAGQAISKVDGSAINDTDALMFTPNGTIGGLCNRESTGVDLLVTNYNNEQCYGTLVPLGEGPTAIAFCRLANLRIYGYGFAHNGDGITLGTYLHLEIENVSIGDGFYNSIGGMNMFVSYPLKMTNCELGSYGACFFGVNSSLVHARNTTFGYVGRAAIRTAGCGTIWDGGITNDFSGQAEGFFIGYDGYSIGAGHRFENIMIDTEGARTNPRVAFFFLQKSRYHMGNKLVIKNVGYGTNSNAPAIHLDDREIFNWTNFPGQVEVETCDFNGDGPLVRVKGKDWKGTFRARRYWCADNVVDIVPSIYSQCNIKTLHDDFFAPPSLGAWQADCHQVNVGLPPEGAVSVWGCAKSGAEGSINPPVWAPLQFRPSRRKNILSGNIFPTFYMDITAVHPSFPSSPAKLKYGLLQDTSSAKILEYVLNRSGSYVHDKIQFCMHPLMPVRTSDLTGGIKNSPVLVNDSSLWNAAANGLKTSKADVVLSGPAWDQDYNVRQRPYGWVVVTGDSNWATGIVNLASGRTTPQKSGFFDASAVTVPAGGLVMGSSVRDGSWSALASTRILDWIFGYQASTTFPTTLYLGLSKTPITAAGTGVTEPTGSGYARVALPLSGGTFKAHDEYGSTWSNSATISFATPTADWGDCDWFFLADAATGGNVWLSAPLHRPVTITAGSTPPTFLPGCLQIQM